MALWSDLQQDEGCLRLLELRSHHGFMFVQLPESDMPAKLVGNEGELIIRLGVRL
jgi:hypothetical protein